jgi:electron transport complex protein RnfD
VTFLASFAVPAWIFGGLSVGQGWLSGGPLFHLFSGSLVLGAFFMAGDPVTSPLTPRAGVIYGAIMGVLAFFLRFYGTLGDGVALAMLLGNCAVPLLDRAMQKRKTAEPRTEASG